MNTVHAENVCGENFELDRALVDSSINTGKMCNQNTLKLMMRGYPQNCFLIVMYNIILVRYFNNIL